MVSKKELPMYDRERSVVDNSHACHSLGVFMVKSDSKVSSAKP